MSYVPEMADIRFGCGLSPLHPPPPDLAAMWAGLTGPDIVAEALPIPAFADIQPQLHAFRQAQKAQNAVRGTPEFKQRHAELQRISKALRLEMEGWMVRRFQRWVAARGGMRDRLEAFWADHFTVIGKQGALQFAVSPYVEAAIRPHVTGRFADMLIAAVTHPMMLHYLDQDSSAGPASKAGTRGKRRRGLNENLAREVLELHTLGVDGPYGQEDVRQLAELFTGMTFTAQDGLVFRERMAEPGQETVLGRRYGGDPPRLEHVHAVLRDLAVHPATARHIAGKLAVHFVSDHPDPALVDHVAARFLDSGGDLAAVYAALLEHPAAWVPGRLNVRPPFDFIAAALRALAVSPQMLDRLSRAQRRRFLMAPMLLMGQRWQTPGGPDGWPEDDAAWITPQGLSARIRWAVTVPPRLLDALPDPQSFVDVALGGGAGPEVRFAASAAETRAEAIGLVLSSPAFQRR